MVLKVKQNEFNKKKQRINDTVLIVINRSDILEFLHLRSWRNLLQEGVKIKFEEEDRVWITNAGT
jgi:hypothetical protein